MMGRQAAAAVSAILLGLCLSSALGTSGAQAADIEVKSRIVSGPAPHSPVPSTTIRFSGPLRAGDALAMKQVLARLAAANPPASGTPLATVEMSSLGGDLNEGLEIGILFRDYNVVTVVRKKDLCLSACALAFLGGTSAHGSAQEPSTRSASHSLERGAKLGFHAFYLNPNSAQSPTAPDPAQGRQQGFSEALAATSSVILYAAELGIDPRFVASMLTKRQDEFAYVNTTEEFLALKVCPIGLERPQTSLAEQALNICNHSTGWTDPAKPSQVREMAPRQAKRAILENIQQNMASLKVSGALSNQLASYAVMRDERSIDNLYADLRAAGVRLPEIVGPVFEVSGYRSAGQEMQCFVGLSADDPSRYAVAIRRPTKWSHPNWAAPRDCRGLYLHGREATLNPRP
jgi:hypothetical protein